MKKTIATRTAAAPNKKATPPRRASPPKRVASGSTGQTPAVQKQPQSKQQAAAQAGMFLHTDDQWSKAYFDSADLHCQERELFG
jgi:hypothetical protein